ncbi:MAG: uroporphyrinogen-III C-methyltransferase [Hyphomicrobiales bacterium]|nr:uroporphyrinogen-III C-methyltransferase [Hyphomicrobiales bacterium]
MKLPKSLPRFEPGWVWLAGAGPGDAGLLSLHALHALGQADVVVHDALVSAEVLSLARSGARLEYAGKRGGKPSHSQGDISLRLIELARRGERVLRLKGGDPMLFGRGAEEALALLSAKVPFRIIPGISAGLGAMACAGIALTHRDYTHAVTFLTGHDMAPAKNLSAPPLDWSALATGSPVLVIYMGLSNLEAIVGQLLSNGRSREEPLAIVSEVSLPGQRVLETNLGNAVADAKAANMPTPALLVVGEILRLREQLCPSEPAEEEKISRVV